MSEPEILFEKRGRIGLITLNRPKALNALTLGMVDLMHPQLKTWATDPSVSAVVITGAGERGFCAGGDIRALYDSGKAGTPYVFDFYAHEYRLNTFIKHYPKPYIALLNGITMGGGVGVSVHGQHRVACENTVFAMPETGIGLFPDVGGTYFLPRLPGEIGMFLALTGTRLKAADMLYCGIAHSYVPFEKFPKLIDALASSDAAPETTIAQFKTEAGDAPLKPWREVIDRCFGKSSVEQILNALVTEGGGAWGDELAKTMLLKSPISTKVTYRQIREGKKTEFDDCMRMEYRLTCRFMEAKDFYEGVRAQIIDKDQKPKWSPPSLAQVSESDVAAYFAPLGPRELALP
jgi:enoyl-CoA hydratase